MWRCQVLSSCSLLTSWKKTIILTVVKFYSVLVEKESNKTQSGPVSDTDSSESDSESEQSSEEEAPPPVVSVLQIEENSLAIVGQVFYL